MKLRTVLLLVLLTSPSVCWGQITLSSGLIDFLDVSYTSSAGWDVHIFDESTLTSYNPIGTTFSIAGPQHLFVRPASDATWGFIGVSGGQLFRATPQNGDPGSQLVMGIATSDLPVGFQNTPLKITMSVAGITNPGEFSYYINDNTPNSAVGDTATPLFSTLLGLNTLNFDWGTAHSYNMGFSAPGIYHVDFQFTGTLSDGNTVTSDFYRYTFDVAIFAVPEPATWALLGMSTVGVLVCVGYVRRRRRLALDAHVPRRT